jgi:hypothetical protein
MYPAFQKADPYYPGPVELISLAPPALRGTPSTTSATSRQPWHRQPGQRRLLGKERDRARLAVAQAMWHWQGNPSFRSVRHEAALASLPPEERQAWARLWADVAQTCDRASPIPKDRCSLLPPC